MTFVEYAQANQKQAEVNLIYKCFPEVTPETPLYEVSAGYQYVPKKGWAIEINEDYDHYWYKEGNQVAFFEFLRGGRIDAHVEPSSGVCKNYRKYRDRDWEEIV
jgi:hypothetical protein